MQLSDASIDDLRALNRRTCEEWAENMNHAMLSLASINEQILLRLPGGAQDPAAVVNRSTPTQLQADEVSRL
jgi:hypothetical protein